MTDAPRRGPHRYAERLGALLDGAARRLGGLLDMPWVEAGLQTVGWLQQGIESGRAADAVAARGVDVTPLGGYARCPLPREGLQLGFAAVDVPELRRGIEQLALALEGEARRGRQLS